LPVITHHSESNYCIIPNIRQGFFQILLLRKEVLPYFQVLKNKYLLLLLSTLSNNWHTELCRWGCFPIFSLEKIWGWYAIPLNLKQLPKIISAFNNVPMKT
jgi:hypothetical protein